MSKVLGILAIVLGIWIGAEVYTNDREPPVLQLREWNLLLVPDDVN